MGSFIRCVKVAGGPLRAANVREQLDTPECLSTRRKNKTLQPTCYPYDCSTVNEDGEMSDCSSRHGVARTRLNSAFFGLSVVALHDQHRPEWIVEGSLLMFVQCATAAKHASSVSNALRLRMETSSTRIMASRLRTVNVRGYERAHHDSQYRTGQPLSVANVGVVTTINVVLPGKPSVRK